MSFIDYVLVSTPIDSSQILHILQTSDESVLHTISLIIDHTESDVLLVSSIRLIELQPTVHTAGLNRFDVPVHATNLGVAVNASKFNE